MKVPSPRELGLPFDEYFPDQYEIAAEIASSQEPVVFYEGPTGVGKSLTAMTAVQLIRQDNPDARAVILCSSKALQLQYQEDFPGVAILWGRSNFRCALDEDFDCSEAPCSIEGMGCSESEKWEICPYYRHKRRAIHSPIVITNMAYFLHEANYVGHLGNLDFLVVDEGDLLERELLRFAGLELSARSLNQAGIELPDLSSTLEARRWASRVLPRVLKKALDAAKAARDDESWLKKAIRLSGHVKRLKRLANIEPEKWVIQKTLTGYTLQPIWATEYGQDYVFRHARKVLVMSATMPPPDVYARQLGVQQGYRYLESDSPFPRENRPINYWPIAKLKGNALGYPELRQISNAVDAILRMFPNQKGIVHTVSYRLRDAILDRSIYRRRFITHNWHGNGGLSREQALEKFKASTEPVVLISPSMSRGVDLPHDQCRFVIVVKVPFLSLGDPQVRARLKQDPEWYAAAAADELVQAFGRGVRARDDYCVGFILDSTFGWFARRNKRLFPDWWRKTVYPIKDLGEAILPPQMKGGVHAANSD